MRLKSLLLRVVVPTALPATALVVAACAGGGGSYSGDYQDTQDPKPQTTDSAIAKTNRSAQLLNESINASTEQSTGGPGIGGATATSVGGFNCLGTFRCTGSTNLTGNVSSKPLTLSLPGVCNYQGSGFNPDGTITQNGKVLGTWSQTATGFKITESVTVTTSTGSSSSKSTSSTTVTVSLDCTKINDTFDPRAIGTGDDDDDIQAPPTSSSGSTTVTIDAGIRK